MIPPKPGHCGPFTCRRTSYQYLGRQRLSSSPSPVSPSAQPTCSVVPGPTLLPLIQFASCLLYLHTEPRRSLPGVGTVSSSSGSAEHKAALPCGWGPMSDRTMQITHARKSLPQRLVNVMAASGYLLLKFGLHN